MRTEREKVNAKITAETLRPTGGHLELADDGESCRLLLLSGGSCTLQWGGETMAVNPGCALLLGQGAGVLQQTSHSAPEILVCCFPAELLRELHAVTQRDFTRLFDPARPQTLYGSVPWLRRLRTLLELMQQAAGEPEYPGFAYLALVLHYVEQEYRTRDVSGELPHNETVGQVCAYLAANYQQKFSLTEVAARFYLSPYYLSRLFRRVTGQSIVDYINGRRIEAAQRLLTTTDLSISDVAEQTGFASAAHFRRVFHEMTGTRPLQYRKEHKA